MKNLISFLVFWFLLVFSLESDDIHSIYIQPLTVDKSFDSRIEKRIRKYLSYHIFRIYGNKYRIIDEDLLKSLRERLKNNQMMGCSDSSCDDLLEEAINPDFKITGEVRRDSNGKFLLSFRLYEFNIQSSGLKRQTPELSFESENFDSRIPDLVHHLFEKDFKIIEGVPLKPDWNVFSFSESEFPKSSFLSTEKSKWFDSKYNDSEVSELILILKPHIERADVQFEMGNYDSAVELYEILIQNIEKSLNVEQQKKLSKEIRAFFKKHQHSQYSVSSFILPMH